MTWDYIAESAADLLGIGDTLLSVRNQNGLDEQLQMTRLLESLVGVTILRYPVNVRHTGARGAPDFGLR